MAREDDINDGLDDLEESFSKSTRSIDRFLEFSENINKKMQNISERTVNIDSSMEKSEKTIKALQNQFNNTNLTWIQQKEINKKIVDNLQTLAKKGIDINSLSKDYEKLFKINLSTLDKSTIKGKKKLLLEEQLFQQYEISKKKEEQLNARKAKINESYDKVANFAEKFSGPFSNVTRKFFESRREGVVGGLAESQSSGLLTKLLSTFGKFPILFGGIAVALGFVASRLFKLVGAEVNLNSEIVKSTGLRASSAKKIETQIATSAGQLKVFFGADIEEAQKKAAEGAGAILKVFGSLRFVSAQRITDVVSLSEKIGISTEESAQYFSTLEQSIGMSNVQVKEFGKSLTLTAEDAGQSLADITKDIANNAEFASIYVDRTGKSLLAAAIQARAMGTSLKEVGDFSKKFTGIDEAFSNIRDLNLLIGKQYNPFEFIAKARFGTPEQQTNQLQRVYQDIIDQQKAGLDITKDAYKSQAAANILSGGSVKEFREILNRIKGGETLDDAKKALEKTRKRDEARKGKITSYAQSLGITEMMTPGDLLLAKILDTLDNAIKPAAETIANIITNIYERLFSSQYGLLESKNSYEYDKKINKQIQNASEKYLKENNAEFVPSDIYQKIVQTTIEGGQSVDLSKIKMPKKALGGITSKTSIAGEAGPEAILPLTGPGKESFTKPFIDKVSSENNKQIISQLKELNDNIKEFLRKPILVESKLFVEGRQLARALTETALSVG